MSKRIHNIFCVAQDAGGFRAVIPVLCALEKKKNYLARGIFSTVSRASIEAKGRQLIDPASWTDAKAERLIKRFKPDLMVFGGSAGLSMDKISLIIARKLHISTLMVLDFCGNLSVLFSTPGTSDFAFVPDFICALNDACTQELVNLGIPKKKILTTGSPAFDDISPSPTPATGPILFICQPFTELEKEFPGTGYGYSEVTVFADIMQALKKDQDTRNVIIKLHPRTRNVNKFEPWTSESSHRVSVDAGTPTSTLIKQASVVVGMNSAALFEAVLCGRPVVSYQPNLKKADPLVSNRWGLSVAVTAKKDLAAALHRASLITGKRLNAKDRQRCSPLHATQNVIHLIEKMLV